jgi:hypothetical protein
MIGGCTYFISRSIQLRFFFLVLETFLALPAIKRYRCEHFPGTFTGAQAEPAARDHRDHRPDLSDLVRFDDFTDCISKLVRDLCSHSYFPLGDFV